MRTAVARLRAKLGYSNLVYTLLPATFTLSDLQTVYEAILGRRPPLLVFGDARATGDWTIIVREDGGKQWAFKGKPLYTWSKDTKAGDKTGDGVNNIWHVAKGN